MSNQPALNTTLNSSNNKKIQNEPKTESQIIRDEIPELDKSFKDLDPKEKKILKDWRYKMALMKHEIRKKTAKRQELVKNKKN